MENEQLSENTVTYGVGDVFHDLGLPDADELVAKSGLAIAIHDTIQQRRLTQAQAAVLIGIDELQLNKIIRGQLSEFSTGWLLGYLLHLGLNVDIVIHKEAPENQREGAIRIAFA